MLQSIKGIIDQNGELKLLEPIKLPHSRRVIITILDEEPEDELISGALLSAPALSKEWDNVEEDEAWSHLAQHPSL